MTSWHSLEEEELRELLGRAANGRRLRGERSGCGRWLLALLQPDHPLLGESWELWQLEGDAPAWPRSSWRRQEDARREAERLGAKDAAAAARRT